MAELPIVSVNAKGRELKSSFFVFNGPSERRPSYASAGSVSIDRALLQVLICAVLYAGAVRFNSACSSLVLRANTFAGLVVFGLSSLFSWLFSTQCAIENRAPSNSSSLHYFVARLASLFLIVIQTLSLACLCRPLARWSCFRWPARYLLGSYLLNVNFLDMLSLSPEVRRQRPQVCGSDAGFRTTTFQVTCLAAPEAADGAPSGCGAHLVGALAHPTQQAHGVCGAIAAVSTVPPRHQVRDFHVDCHGHTAGLELGSLCLAPRGRARRDISQGNVHACCGSGLPSFACALPTGHASCLTL